MSRTVYLHIGLAKSGTTYVQHLLQANRALLDEHGVLFPGPKMSEHFMAALDLSQISFRGHKYPEAEGAWERIAAAANQHPGSTVISHEMFAPTSAELIRQGLDSLGTDDIRVVVTARDLARQVPAVWQERVKNGNQERYVDYLESIFRSDKGRKHQGGFWRQQHLLGITQRWADLLGPERLTIVTLPQSGADSQELWRRFATAIDLPDLDYSFDVGGRNQSLGVVESELLRRLNGQLPEFPWPQYVRRIKRRFSEGTLAAASSSSRLAVPRGYQEEIAKDSEATLHHLEALGCRVVGDLRDLRPRFPDSDPPTPDGVVDGELLELALGQLGKYVSRPLPPKPVPTPVDAHPEPGARNFLRTLKARVTRRATRH